MNRKLKGWRHISGPVYENKDGTRIHLLGFIKFKDGTFISANMYPHSIGVDKSIKIQGGNRKRGLMQWSKYYREVL